MKTTKPKYNPHKWFFGYVSTLADFDRKYEKVIRAGIVSEYTDGATDSLSDMYLNHNWQYIQMKKALMNEKVDALDKARKRVIAVLFSYLQFNKRKATMQYVKAVACNAAQVDHFNNIPLKKLKSLYRIFGEKKNKEANEWVNQVLSNITLDEETIDNQRGGTTD
ncbi:hypothetical protein [Dysgonomonas reticulitermitis]